MTSKQIAWCAWAIAIAGLAVITACGKDRGSVQIAGPEGDPMSTTGLTRPAGKMSAGQRSVVVATVTQGGAAIGEAELAFSRTISGRSPDYRWTGTTDAAGRVTVEILADAPQFWRVGVSGYYLARLADAASGDVLGQWSSIPINGGREMAVRLAVGEPAQITWQSGLDAKTMALRQYEEIWNQGNLAVVDELIALNYIYHDPFQADGHGPEEYKGRAAMLHGAFPDLTYTIDDQIAQGNSVVTRWTIRGAHQGNLAGIPPTGVQIIMPGITVNRIARGQIQEDWTIWDALGTMQQLGVAPPMGVVDFSWGEPAAAGGGLGDPEANKILARRWVEEIWNKGDLSVVDEIVSPDHVYHDPFQVEGHGPEEYKQRIAVLRNAFPDLVYTIEDQVAEGDRVFTRWVMRGTHQGELAGIPPTGAQITMAGMTINLISNGLIVEDWTVWDALGVMQQLGVIPPMQ